jgi:hypothetical protein
LNTVKSSSISGAAKAPEAFGVFLYPIPVIRRTEKRMLAMAATRGVFKRTDQVCFLLQVALTIAAGNCLVAY